MTCTLTTTDAVRRRLRAVTAASGPRRLASAVVYAVTLTAPPTSDVNAAFAALLTLTPSSFSSTQAALAAATGLAPSAFVVSGLASAASCGGGGDTCTLPSRPPSSSLDIGAIVGGVIGGIAGLALIGTLAYAYRTGYFRRGRPAGAQALGTGTPSGAGPSPAAGAQPGGAGPRGNIVTLNSNQPRGGSDLSYYNARGGGL